MLRSFCGAHAQEYRHSVRDWLGSAIPADWRDHRLQLSEDSQKRIRRQWNSILYESGHAAIRWPAEYGGSGLGPIEDLIFQEEAADSFAPDGFGRIQRMLAGAVLLEHGNQEQKAKYLPKIIAGTELWCQGFSEPNVGSDLAAVETEAVRDGPGYWINGKKIWTGR
jgi:alkylation response protein AidB-like acyl-CoA dehydrogenase